MDYKSTSDYQIALPTQYQPAALYTTQVDDVYNLPPQQGVVEKARRKRRTKKGERTTSGFTKRKLSEEQAYKLELNFSNEQKLESERKDRLASELGLDPQQVAIWFQNRRARWKCKKLEEDYSKLKNEHRSTIVEKCQLQSEVMKLKEQLSEAEKERKRLKEAGCKDMNGSSSSSSCTSFSMDALMELDQPFLGDFVLDDGLLGLDEDVFNYVPADDNQYYNLVNGLEWVYFM